MFQSAQRTTGSTNMGVSPHTATFKWKRVIVKFRDGTEIRDKFIDRTNKFVILEKHGRILRKDIKAFIIDKRIHHEHKNETTRPGKME